MSFIDHLEELRWHIIRAVIAVLIGAIGVFVYVREIVEDILHLITLFEEPSKTGHLFPEAVF